MWTDETLVYTVVSNMNENDILKFIENIKVKK